MEKPAINPFSNVKVLDHSCNNYYYYLNASFSEQVPFSDLRNDARENLMGALVLAGSERYHVPEVYRQG